MDSYALTKTGLSQGAFTGWIPSFCIEPMFYWRDALGPLHKRYLDQSRYVRFKHHEANPEARAVVYQLRGEIKNLFLTIGALHGQIGKYYDFPNMVEPNVMALLTKIKSTLDPTGSLNPGNFGWNFEREGV